MKYTVTIEINLPRAKVVELFENPDNMAQWQPGFISMEHLSGEKGKAGARSKLNYKMGKREIEMIETILVNDLPNEFSGTFEADKVWNEVRNYFEEKDENTTLWRSECEFRFKGMMKVFAFLMPGVFKKQSFKYLENFKAFAEGETVA